VAVVFTPQPLEKRKKSENHFRGIHSTYFRLPENNQAGILISLRG